MRPGGVLVIDDFTPRASWPPEHAGRVDTARLHWLDHPRRRSCQVNVRADAATVLAAYIGEG